jgi:hypothetical protein
MSVKVAREGKRGRRVELCKGDLAFEWSSFSTKTEQV